ncbi:hypothetical protein [Geobacter sp. DSM 9736]|uniref:hypothetical protein n=1 Tax=Geobacter sp. DSM 9736 TaxID=1277350 RepID=UPI000B5DEB4C|nr:hypothetical protein [Geobacter sp. DSM 9736]SNB46083.1 hypothetical protein SAMN06269301_1523 [Geobacter sp. DSM 9736]
MAAELKIEKGDFALGTLDDELRVDGLCKELLRNFYDQLLDDGLSPSRATELAGSADYFVRDFLVSIKQLNLFTEVLGTVRQFAGNWYIVSTLEPNMTELGRHLEGIREFYRFLHRRGWIAASCMEKIESECSEAAYYESRIESFWNISGDGYGAWERECSLKQD